ncbi:hypothetical protein SH580_07365 [Coraliomargarita algicola]|uniref:Metallo-beta-lactamase domain-containing protein n=1 Tax=Coraliomargarita algicola TaxID=3092156 RepID=A0ABZ0RPT1_9BACT|nr:hypothetical protein [Coraliomargarita sp. J2-16]WPJ97527.1 hypothetical protein SH580_07365 [Coraliomargarita sp. J2-16]
MSVTLHHYFAFRPVGQGLFAHGSLARREGKIKPFNWLYDCGISGKFSILQNQIQQYLKTEGNEIDLAMLSHYDQDHVNGVVELIKHGGQIRTLVLPYLYPAQRLRLLMDASGSANWYLRFLTSPAQYLQSLEAEGSVEQVLFISPGGDEYPQEPESNTPEPDFPPKENKKPRRNLDMGDEKTSTQPIDGFSAEEDSDFNHRTLLQNSSQPFTALGLWEFCFYNRPQELKDLQQWWQDAEPHWRQFQSSNKTPKDYEHLIRDMQAATVNNPALPKSAFDANEVSLQVYAGPLTRNLSRADRFNGILTTTEFIHLPLAPNHLMLRHRHPSTNSIRENGGFLFTGDITMDAPTSKLIEDKFLGQGRWQRLSYLQVPHHGASKSWRPKVYKNWHHQFSIFSARCIGGYGHPHKDVVDDLVKRNPIMVNAYQGFVGYENYRFN